MPKAIPFRILVLLSFLLLPALAWATHNRAGEIIVEQVGDCGSSLRVKATIITYTEAFSQADRDSLDIVWGDGDSVTLQRSSELFLENGIKRNEYIGFHDYTGFGTYRISTTDPNRVADIINIDDGNSVNIRFHIFTIYTLTNPQFSGCNSSPVLEQFPLDRACVGEVWTHNPGAFDPDGDSLSFEFTIPKAGPGVPVPNYVFPNDVGPGSNSLSIDPVTGDIRWETPSLPGDYNLAFFVISWRNGVPIDTLIRDMQIFVGDCENDPPVIETEFDEVCVVAGELVEFGVVATAPLTDEDQLVRFEAAGAPFVVPTSPATFEPDDPTYQTDPVARTFRWQTTCDHISDQPYIVVFRAVDNGLTDTTGLATLRSVRITVVGPPPEDLQTEATSEEVTLTWDLPYVCEDAADELFLGFTVWRRINSNNFPPDTCQTGLAGRGYTQVSPAGEYLRTVEAGRYIFRDPNVERGRTYCYRVLAVFGRRTSIGGFVYREIESLPSEEICVQLGRDLPLLLQVDVAQTNPTGGVIDVCWTKPQPADLDTLLNPGPYVYRLLRADGQTANPAAFAPIGVEFVVQNFSDPVDTCYTDTGLNTQGQAYSYLVDFFVNSESAPLGNGTPASSVFLTVAPTDEANDLSWTAEVPWDNYAFDLYRQAPGSSDFELLAAGLTDPDYRDEGLVNGEEYCYYVLAYGTYGVTDIREPLLNRSQEVCASPRDNVPPCPPAITVLSVCERDVDCQNAEELYNEVRWNHPEEICPEIADDVAGYRVYYAPTLDGGLEQVAEIDDAELFFYQHRPPLGIAGCYAVTAFDDLGNESALSEKICVENCPFYDLPNTFTPNGDNQNDFFVPREFCFIERVDFQVFDRWGTLVFQTTDPELNWDGRNARGELLNSGTYYYTCQVFERRVGGVVPNPELLRGYIELVRGSE